MILGGGYASLGACVMVVRTGQWLWLSVPVALLLFGLLTYFIARQIETRARKSVDGTVYGLTTGRALIVHTYPALAVKSLRIDAITDVTIVGDQGDLVLHAASAPASLMFGRVCEPERARDQLMHVIRDPQAADQEIATAESYALQMRRLMQGTARN